LALVAGPDPSHLRQLAVGLNRHEYFGKVLGLTRNERTSSSDRSSVFSYCDAGFRE